MNEQSQPSEDSKREKLVRKRRRKKKRSSTSGKPWYQSSSFKSTIESLGKLLLILLGLGVLALIMWLVFANSSN